jgi:hypothetical protein
LAIALLVMRTAEASGSNAAWVNMDLGLAIGAGQVVNGGAGGGLSFRVGATRPLRGTLRSSVELQGTLFSDSGIGGSWIPEISVTSSPSAVISALTGIETYGPVRGHSAPFVNAGIGVAYTIVGDSREVDTSPGIPVTTVTRGAREFRPAFGASVGFRRLPHEAGTNPRLSVSYLLVMNSGSRSHIYSAALGLGF